MASLFPHSESSPILPPFRTLLIKGVYHPSAPIHLALSHTSQHSNSKAVLITPTRRTLCIALQNYNDDWLSQHGGSGSISSISSRIELFYPPSPTHLAFLLAMFRVSRPSDGPSFNPKVYFDVVPSLLIIQEPSSYFLDDNAEQSHTISSYLTLISHALATLSFLCVDEPSVARPSFALFDSQLDQLKLPILRPVPGTRSREDEDHDQSSRKESVCFFVKKYFEWMASFEQASILESNSRQGERRKRMTLCPTAQEDHATTLEWAEILRPAHGPSEKQRTVFDW